MPSPTDDPALTEDEDPLEETAAVVEAYGPQFDEEQPAAAEAATAKIEPAETEEGGETEPSALAEQDDADEQDEADAPDDAEERNADED